jgi:hypothetical protein
MKTAVLAIFIFLITCSCETSRIIRLNSKFSKHQFIDSIEYLCKDYSFYNPFANARDTIWNPIEERPRLASVIIRESNSDGYGVYRVFLDSSLYIRCDCFNKKISGLCRSYSLINPNKVRRLAAMHNDKLDGEMIEYENDSIVKRCIYQEGKLVRCDGD